MVAAANNDGELSGLTNITFPAALLIQVEGAEEAIYTGEMIGHISGAADISIAAADGRQCKGRMSAKGSGQLDCDGVLIPMSQAEEERASMSGAVFRDGVVVGSSYAAAFGWGRGAQERVLRESIARRASLGGKQARAIAG